MRYFIYMLDFSIYSDVDRSKAVYSELENLKKPPTQSQLETMANYILFGKDENDQNAVDRGEVQIQTKYNSYKIRKYLHRIFTVIKKVINNLKQRSASFKNKSK